MLELQSFTLNFNSVVIASLIASIICLIITIIAFWMARRKEIKAMYLFGLHFLFAGLSTLFEALAELFLNIPLRNVALMNMVLVPLAFILFFSYIRKESFFSLELSIWAALVTLVCVFEFDPMQHTIDYGPITSLSRSDFLSNLLTLPLIFYVIIVIYWILITFIKSPKKLKKISFLLILIIPISILLTFFMASVFHVGIASTSVFIIIISLLFLFALIYRPYLLFILPFRAYRLIVIETRTGISLFKYEWAEEQINEDLLSGFISAIRSMGEEILQKGGIRQIDWELGILFFSKQKHTISTLLSSKTSKWLRSSLFGFSGAFETKFQHILESDLKDLSEFDSATELILQFFPNLPK